jgi:hypothetical protein
MGRRTGASCSELLQAVDAGFTSLGEDLQLGQQEDGEEDDDEEEHWQQGAVDGDINTKKCEDCQLKAPSFGLPAEGKARWCGGCAKAHTGAVDVVIERKRWCDGVCMQCANPAIKKRHTCGRQVISSPV